MIFFLLKDLKQIILVVVIPLSLLQLGLDQLYKLLIQSFEHLKWVIKFKGHRKLGQFVIIIIVVMAVNLVHLELVVKYYFMLLTLVIRDYFDLLMSYYYLQKYQKRVNFKLPPLVTIDFPVPYYFLQKYLKQISFKFELISLVSLLKNPKMKSNRCTINLCSNLL